MHFNLCRVMLALLFAIVLSACQSVVRTDIATFKNTDKQYPKGSIKVVSADAQIQDSLEFKFFKKGLETHLYEAGYSPVSDGDKANYIATLAYQVSRQEKDKPQSRILLGGGLGHYSPYHRSTVIVSDDLGAEYEYLREMNLSIFKPRPDEKSDKPKEQILQINASSIGKCRFLTVVYDEMLQAIFTDLMRPDGSVVKVAVKGETHCP